MCLDFKLLILSTTYQKYDVPIKPSTWNVFFNCEDALGNFSLFNMRKSHRQEHISLTATADQPVSLMKRASPNARWWPAHYCSGGDVEVSRSSVQRAEQLSPLNLSLSRGLPRTGFRIALRRRKSRLVVLVPFFFFNFFWFRVAGVTVRRRPDQKVSIVF